jgi:sugar phosphate isomerase/epimerase
MAVKTSIGSWAYLFGEYADKPIKMEEAAQKLSDLHFDGMQLGGFKPHGHPELYPTKKDRKKLVKLFKSHGLTLNAYGADLWAYPFATGGHEMDTAYDKAFEESLKMCVDCGIPIIRVDTVTETPYPKDFKYDDAWDKVRAKFRQVTQEARRKGVKVVWEFEPGYIFNKPSEIVKMLEQVGNDNFKLQADTCHVQMCAVIGAHQWGDKETLPGGQVEFYKMTRGMIGDIHIIDSDNKLHDNHTSIHAPFGTGYIDFEKVVPAIVENGYDSPWWTIDLCFWPNAWEITEDSKKYVDGLFKKLGMT